MNSKLIREGVMVENQPFSSTRANIINPYQFQNISILRDDYHRSHGLLVLNLIIRVGHIWSNDQNYCLAEPFLLQQRMSLWTWQHTWRLQESWWFKALQMWNVESLWQSVSVFARNFTRQLVNSLCPLLIGDQLLLTYWIHPLNLPIKELMDSSIWMHHFFMIKP
jgi:hypothetical protein